MKRLFAAAAATLICTSALAQNWSAGEGGTARIPAAISGTAVAGGQMQCAGGAWFLRLDSFAASMEGVVPAALVIDGSVFPTVANSVAGGIAVPGDAIEALKAGNKMIVTLGTGADKLEASFALRGSRKALEAAQASCGPALAAGQPAETKPVATPTETAAAKPAEAATAAGPAQENTVTQGEYAMTAPASIKAGAGLEVKYTAPDIKDARWIGFARPGDRDDAFMFGASSYVIRNRPLMLTAPSQAGDYELRFVHQKEKKILASMPITVTPADPASLDAPQMVVGGQTFDVSVTGPDGENNFVAVVNATDNAQARHVWLVENLRKNPVKVRAPSKAGTYELRYVLAGGEKIVAASQTITVSEPTPVVVPALEAKAGEPFAVALDDAIVRANGDYLHIAKADATADDKTGGDIYVPFSGEAKFKAAPEAGDWELRYVSPIIGGWAIRGRAPLTVK